MELLETSLLLGLVSGLLYALSGAGLVLIYRTSGYVSFAQGDIAAIGLFIAFATYKAGMPYPVVAAVAIVGCAVVGGLIGTFAIIPLERFGPLTAGLATIAVGVFIQGVENSTVGSTPRPFPAVSEAKAFGLHDVQLQVSQLVQVGVTVALFIAMGLAFRRLSSGVALRAINDNPEAAELLGIPAHRLKRMSWVLAGALAGVAGLFIVPLYTLTPTSVNAILLFGFCAIVVGGFDSISGALLGGLIIGLAANLTSAYVTPNLVTTVLYLTVLVVLLVRPHGLMGRTPLRRV